MKKETAKKIETLILNLGISAMIFYETRGIVTSLFALYILYQIDYSNAAIRGILDCLKDLLNIEKTKTNG